MTGPSISECVCLTVAETDDGLLRARTGSNGTAGSSWELPFADRSVAGFQLDESAARLSVRNRLQLLIECRRSLKPSGLILLPRSGAQAVHAVMARWAALVGLVERHDGQASTGWQKHADSIDPKPLVSILIPASNPRYFLECLDSAIAQTHSPVEIIVCDDSEGAEVEAMVSSRCARAPINYYRNEPRLRARLNYEKLLSLARGEYIKFLNDDDLLAPDCIAALLKPFCEIPDLSLVTSHRQIIDENSQPIPDIPATRPVTVEDIIISGISLANSVIMHGLNIVGEPSTMLFRKRDFAWRPHLDGERPFHFNGEEVRGAADLAMASRVLVQGNAVFLCARLSSFRRHAQQAQARADVVIRSIAGIRGLQRQWIELGLFRGVHPNILETRRLSPEHATHINWNLSPVLSLPPTGNLPEEDVRRWRDTRRHAFDFVASVQRV
jgi:hypothetical protein